MKNLLRLFYGLVMMALLQACGGGGSVTRDATPTTPDPDPAPVTEVSLAIQSAVSGESNNQLTLSNPLTIIATVIDQDGNPVADQLVTFTFSNEGIATFSNDTGTALTNAEGVAEIGLLVGTSSGDGQVLATLASGGTAEIGFSSTGAGSVQPAFLRFVASSLQLASSGSDEITLTAVVLNAQSVVMEGIEVSFSANAQSNSRLVVNNGGVTEANGTATATLSTIGNPENRTIDVTATVASNTLPLTETLQIQVIGTDVVLNGPQSVILSGSAQYSIVVQDSDGNGVPNVPVQLSSALGNVLSNTSPITDAAGSVNIEYTASIAGSDVITATALNATGTFPLTVQQDQFSFVTSPSEEVPLNANANLTLRWLRQGVPFVNGDVTFSTTRGTLSATSGTTNASGDVSFTVSSQNAGPAVISAVGTDSNDNVVNARVDVEFVATVVDSIQLSASPSSIGPDGQLSTITAVVRDPQGNRVKNQTVTFSLDDVSGGSIFPGVAVTDSNGLASTVYTSNTVTSEDAVLISASVEDSGLSQTTALTVADRELFITVGTGNTISSPDEATYEKIFSVFVTDANSNPVSGVDLTVSGTPVSRSELADPNNPGLGARAAFFKGFWVPFPSRENFEFWVPERTVACPNEDLDEDAILDSSPINEDTNGDGSLSPGQPAAIDGNVTTDDNGQALLTLRYPKTFAAWVTLKLTVSAPVSGSESSTSLFYTLDASAADLTIESTPPNENPFGTGPFLSDDDNDPTTPLVLVGAGNLCNNTL